MKYAKKPLIFIILEKKGIFHNEIIKKLKKLNLISFNPLKKFNS